MEKLKILLVSHGVVSSTSGVGKVHYELKQAYKALGHYVEVLDMQLLYPRGQRKWHRIFQKHFTWRILQYLKQHAHRFDVIDANFECIVYPKKAYRFNGLVVARSHGIMPFYIVSEKSTVFQQTLSKRTEPLTLKTRIGNLYRKIEKTSGPKEFELSIRHADVLHCLNEDEYNYFSEQSIPAEKLVVVPNGLADKVIEQYNAIPVSTRGSNLAFMGSWTYRKGINDLEEILNELQKSVKVDTVYLLGGGYPEAYVRSFFSEANQPILKVITHYQPTDIAGFLQDCKVSMFPSYIEGFPIAVIEQLACGVPMVAYNVPGPRGILQSVGQSWLVEPGNTKAMAAQLADLLRLNGQDYQLATIKAREIAGLYKLNAIAERFIEIYKTRLRSL